MNIICVSHTVDNVGDIWRHPFSTSFSNGGLHYLHTAQRLSSSGRRRLLLLLAFDFTRSFQVHLVPDRVLLVPDRVLLVRRRTPSFTFFLLHICYMLCWSIPLVCWAKTVRCVISTKPTDLILISAVLKEYNSHSLRVFQIPSQR